MKKYVNPLPTGGVPIFSENVNDALQKEFWDALEAAVVTLAGGNAAIVSGCIVASLGGSNYSVSAGIVVIDGVLQRQAAVASTTLPAYLKSDVPVIVTAAFEDGGTKNLTTEQKSILTTSIPGSGQYVTLSLTGNLGGLGGFRLENVINPAIVAQLLLKVDKAQAAWINLTLAGSWTNTGANLPRYRITSQNKLELSGIVLPGGASIVANLPNLTIPSTFSINIPIINITTHAGVQMTLSGGSPTTIQIIGFVGANQYDLCCSVALDANN